MGFYIDNRELISLVIVCLGMGFGSIVWAILFTSD